MLSNLAIPYLSPLFLAKGMDIREIRRKNLALLREQQGSVRALADRVDTDPNYLSQILNSLGKHHMGHAMARRFEIAFSKPQGWMDQSHDQKEDEGHDDGSLSRIYLMAKLLTPLQRKSFEPLMKAMIAVDIQPISQIDPRPAPPHPVHIDGRRRRKSVSPPPPPSKSNDTQLASNAKS